MKFIIFLKLIKIVQISPQLPDEKHHGILQNGDAWLKFWIDKIILQQVDRLINSIRALKAFSILFGTEAFDKYGGAC
jgi:hypothetical protein